MAEGSSSDGSSSSCGSRLSSSESLSDEDTASDTECLSDTSVSLSASSSLNLLRPEIPCLLWLPTTLSRICAFAVGRDGRSALELLGGSSATTYSAAVISVLQTLMPILDDAVLHPGASGNLPGPAHSAISLLAASPTTYPALDGEVVQSLLHFNAEQCNATTNVVSGHHCRRLWRQCPLTAHALARVMAWQPALHPRGCEIHPLFLHGECLLCYDRERRRVLHKGAHTP